jgi:hypothetical protein
MGCGYMQQEVVNPLVAYDGVGTVLGAIRLKIKEG